MRSFGIFFDVSLNKQQAVELPVLLRHSNDHTRKKYGNTCNTLYYLVLLGIKLLIHSQISTARIRRSSLGMDE